MNRQEFEKWKEEMEFSLNDDTAISVITTGRVTELFNLLSKEISEKDEELKGLKKENEKLSYLLNNYNDPVYKEALQGILKNPHGCPMCDSGKLRNPEKEHWDNCPYLFANQVLNNQL